MLNKLCIHFSYVYKCHNCNVSQFTGQNIYGIVRAPRASSTEAIVVSVPYRPINSIYLDTAPSIALLLAFAKFCRSKYVSVILNIYNVLYILHTYDGYT